MRKMDLWNFSHEEAVIATVKGMLLGQNWGPWDRYPEWISQAANSLWYLRIKIAVEWLRTRPKLSADEVHADMAYIEPLEEFVLLQAQLWNGIFELGDMFLEAKFCRMSDNLDKNGDGKKTRRRLSTTAIATSAATAAISRGGQNSSSSSNCIMKSASNHETRILKPRNANY